MSALRPKREATLALCARRIDQLMEKARADDLTAIDRANLVSHIATARFFETDPRIAEEAVDVLIARAQGRPTGRTFKIYSRGIDGAWWCHEVPAGEPA